MTHKIIHPSIDRKVPGITSGRRIRQRAGISLIVLCLLFPVVLAIAAFAINIVYMEFARTELQIATDVATRASGRALAVTGRKEEAIRAAERLLAANRFCNRHLPISATNIAFGVSTRDAESQRYRFGAGMRPNAVQMQANGSVKVPLIFPTMGAKIDFRPIKSAISTQMEMDIAIVLDRSTSMIYAEDEQSDDSVLETFPPGWLMGSPAPLNTRWRKAEYAIQNFLDYLNATHQSEQVSLSTFGLLGSTDVGLTQRYTKIRSALQFHGGLYLGGPSNLGDGIASGTDSLSDPSLARPWATRVMVIVSDGLRNIGNDAIAAAERAAAQKIHIYTLGVSSEANTGLLQQVSQIGIGTHQHAASGAELQQAFVDIAHSLPTLLTN